eukprot:COSAG05_NODE_17516_length_324_cov_0.524444_1_plen_59_part_10
MGRERKGGRRGAHVETVTDLFSGMYPVAKRINCCYLVQCEREVAEDSETEEGAEVVGEE